MRILFQKLFISFFTSIVFLISCSESVKNDSLYSDGLGSEEKVLMPTKPLVRWWWFASKINEKDIKRQLDWVKYHHFGGVEIAWVYPLFRYNKIYSKHHGKTYPHDSTAQQWLSKDWTKMVLFAKKYADSIGLQCDFTLGSAWPSAAEDIPKHLSSQIYGDSSFRQKVTFAWNFPDSLTVINHLDSNAFNFFSKPIMEALNPALMGNKSSIFSDSWEIKLNSDKKIWTKGFENRFYNEYGYDLIPFMNSGLDSFPDVRYDYMKLLNIYILEGFYNPFERMAKDLGVFSRVQCLASPTDVMSAYAVIDIPESEAMLNTPNFSRIVSSTAALASKYLVSCETFTCPYGFPGTYMREEQVADLKMIVDALLANGVNMFVYHGMPYNTIEGDTNDFFATTYFGPGSPLEKEIKELNKYVEKVSTYMRLGTTYSDVAVYLPYEDALMNGAYPKEKQRAWVWGQYEMRYLKMPNEVEGYHPLWINQEFLNKGKVENGRLKIGEASFSILYMDVEYIDFEALQRVNQLAKDGLAICLKRKPKQAGKTKNAFYDKLLNELLSLERVSSNFSELIDHPPLIFGEYIPAYWAKVDEEKNLYIFIAQKQSKDLNYPLYSGQSFDCKTDTLTLELNFIENDFPIELVIPSYQSKLLKISSKGQFTEVNIEYLPSIPVIRPKERQRATF